MKKKLIIILGACFGILNLTPMPWSFRVLYLRFLYALIVFGTGLFPSILRWTEQQNTKYQMGKQAGESYESIVQLEKVLEYLENKGIPVDQVKKIVEAADSEQVPNDQLGDYIGRAILDQQSAEFILKESLRQARY